MNEKITQLKKQIEAGKFQEVFDYLDLYFEENPFNQYSTIKMNILHQINMGFAPNPMQIQGFQLFLNSSKIKEVIPIIEQNNQNTTQKTTETMAYGADKEIKGLEEVIDLLVDKVKMFTLAMHKAIDEDHKLSYKLRLKEEEKQLEIYRQKIQKLKGENPFNSDLKELDNKTQKAQEKIEESLKEEETEIKPKKKINIFVSYSSKDRDLREILVEGLQSHLTHRKGFEYLQWTDKQIDLGADWKSTIEKALTESNVAILLVSSNFASSSFINQNELTEFFERQQKGGYLILPVLVRKYDFSQFEVLSKLNFFKTYHNEYDFNKPTERNKLLPFDKLAENENTTDEKLNLYYEKLADFIHTAISNKF
jgi:hypothetical protein